MTTFETYRKHANQLDSSLFLGHLCWYQVGPIRVSHEQVVRGLLAAQLDAYLPPAPRDFLVFKRVATDAQLRKQPVPGDSGVFENYLLREINAPGDSLITRRLVVETVNRNGKRLGYRQLRDITYDKASSIISVSVAHPDLEPEVNPIADQMMVTIQREFLAWKGMLNHFAIRENLIRRTLASLGATMVRDGLYFVPEAKADTLNKLEGFVNGLPGNAAMFHSMPLLDDAKQRAMIRHAFEADTQGSIDEVMAEIQALRKEGKQITADRYVQLKTRYDQLTANTAEYKDILEVSLDETESRLMLFHRQIVALLAQVK